MTDLPLVDLREAGSRARDAARELRRSSPAQRIDVLWHISHGLLEAQDAILGANEVDLKAAVAGGAPPSQIDRLFLDESRVKNMADAVMSVASLDEVVGKVVDGWTRPNGLEVRRVRVPLGVVGVIYENRPNVTSDAAALCLRSANATLLRGSSQALASNIAIGKVIRSALSKTTLPLDSVAVVQETSRESAVEFMRLRGYIDCLIPRGGRSLIESIRENATVPYVLDGDGNCHIYVDRSADMEMARDIVVNSKTQRPGVCNAAETLLVHREIAEGFLQALDKDLQTVEIRGDEETMVHMPRAIRANDQDYATEFLDLILAVRVVDSIDEAIEHIDRYGSGHSEAIVTNDHRSARKFLSYVDAAAVLVNASTRFVDGAEIGFGAEIGISTQKLHARGPMGLEQLTTLKLVIEGNGQIRS